MKTSVVRRLNRAKTICLKSAAVQNHSGDLRGDLYRDRDWTHSRIEAHRVGIALLGAIGMMIFGGVTTAEAVSYVNWPTICLLFGFFVISAQLRLSGFYDKVAESLAISSDIPRDFF